jgi:hypothetical protein
MEGIDFWLHYFNLVFVSWWSFLAAVPAILAVIAFWLNWKQPERTNKPARWAAATLLMFLLFAQAKAYRRFANEMNTKIASASAASAPTPMVTVNTATNGIAGTVGHDATVNNNSYSGPPPQPLAADVQPVIFGGAYGTAWPSPGEILPANAHAFEIGQPIKFVTGVRNVGNADAEDVLNFGHVYFETSADRPPIEQFERDKIKFFEQHRRFAATLVDGGTTVSWFNAASDENFSTDMWPDLHTGAKTMYVMQSTEFRDPTGRRYVHVCKSLQAPKDVVFTPMFFATWHICPAFNDRK